MPAYKDEHNNTWYVKFYYQNYEGQRKQKLKRGFALKREAESFEREFLQNISYQPTMSFRAFYKLFQKDTAPRLREHTLQTRGYIYKNRIAPTFDEMVLNAITAKDIRQWQNQLIEQGFSKSYITNCHKLLAAIFKHAVRFYGLGGNPCEQAGAVNAVRAKQEMQFWTLDEYQKAIAAMDDIKARTAVTLLYWSGMRKGELLALLWSDIDLETGKLSITKSLQRLNGKNVVTEPKTAKSNRIILLPEPALKALREYKSRFYAPALSDSVFPWEKRFIEKGMDSACKASGVKRIRVHDLRHSHASLLIEKGFSPLLIAQRLGHESVSTTLNVYSHLWPNKEQEMIAKLNALG